MVGNLTFFSRRPNSRAQRGFTLVEVLLALMILGLAGAVVILNAPPTGQTAKKEALRFAARLDAASSEAIMTGEVMGLDIYTDGYRFLRFRRGQWVEADGRVLGVWLLQPSVTLAYQVTQSVSLKENDKIIARSGTNRGFDGVDFDANDENRITPPPVQFHPYGQDTPVLAAFADKRSRWLVTLDDAGGVEVRRDTAS
ncbi:MAG: type II secretion system minor pseudopilin GspH [Pseudomonadota bacterium]